MGSCNDTHWRLTEKGGKLVEEQQIRDVEKGIEVTSPRGADDILPSEIPGWTRAESLARDLFERFGYREIRTPMFEETALFERGTGESSEIVQKQMYTFTDRKGRSLTLRPEGTPSVVRAYIEHKMHVQQPLQKLYYIGPMFRYERPQAGRKRQHHQIGAEVIGCADPATDFELIYLACQFYNMLGLREVSVKINNLGCKADQKTYASRLYDFLKGRADRLCPDCRMRLERSPLRILDCKVEECQQNIQDAPVITDVVCKSCAKHHASVIQYMKDNRIGYADDPRLVRGLEYYTRTVFEVVHGGLGAKDALMGGGRYDDLVEELGGPKTPAAGFALGLERAMMALTSEEIVPHTERRADLYVAAMGDRAKRRAVSLAMRARALSFKVIMEYGNRSLKAHLRSADKAGAHHVAILGEKELERGVVVLKDMLTGEQSELPLDGFVERFIKMLTDETGGPPVM
jgi:histidyl-tRNA synthetase